MFVIQHFRKHNIIFHNYRGIECFILFMFQITSKGRSDVGRSTMVLELFFLTLFKDLFLKEKKTIVIKNQNIIWHRFNNYIRLIKCWTHFLPIHDTHTLSYKLRYMIIKTYTFTEVPFSEEVIKS